MRYGRSRANCKMSWPKNVLHHANQGRVYCVYESFQKLSCNKPVPALDAFSVSNALSITSIHPSNQPTNHPIIKRLLSAQANTHIHTHRVMGAHTYHMISASSVLVIARVIIPCASHTVLSVSQKSDNKKHKAREQQKQTIGQM